MEPFEPAGIHPQIRIPKPTLRPGLKLALRPIGKELKVIHKSKQATGDGRVEVGPIHFHKVHPIHRQDDRKESIQRLLGIDDRPACLGTVGWKLAGGQPLGPHP